MSTAQGADGPGRRRAIPPGGPKAYAPGGRGPGGTRGSALFPCTTLLYLHHCNAREGRPAPVVAAFYVFLPAPVVVHTAPSPAGRGAVKCRLRRAPTARDARGRFSLCTGPDSGFVITPAHHPENYRTTPAGRGAANCGSITIWLFFHTLGEGSVSTGERSQNFARNPLKRDIRGF